MKITKLASFSEEDQKVLITAGEFLGQLKANLVNKEIDQVDFKASDLLLALADITKEVTDILFPEKVEIDEEEED